MQTCDFPENLPNKAIEPFLPSRYVEKIIYFVVAIKICFRSHKWCLFHSVFSGFQACMGAKYISLLYVLVNFNILPALSHPVPSCPGECYIPPRNGIHVGTI